MQIIRDRLGETSQVEAVPSVVVLGNFDGIHQGHRLLLKEADQMAAPILRKPDQEPLFQTLRRRVITFSPHPKLAMGQTGFRLIYSEHQKAEILEETGLVDELILLSFDETLRQMTPKEFFLKVLCERYGAKAVVVGSNFHFGRDGRGTAKLLQKLCDAHGLSCRILLRKKEAGEPISSSRIRVLLEEGEMEKANELLGRPYFVEGRVSHGKQLGRRMQTPTINLLMREERLAPKKGVYVSRTYTEGGAFASISNVGHNPTVGGESLRTETHILDFSGDLYDQTVRIELLKFLRPEQRFDSVEALQHQLAKDVASAKEYYNFGRKS